MVTLIELVVGFCTGLWRAARLIAYRRPISPTAASLREQTVRWWWVSVFFFVAAAITSAWSTTTILVIPAIVAAMLSLLCCSIYGDSGYREVVSGMVDGA